MIVTRLQRTYGNDVNPPAQNLRELVLQPQQVEERAARLEFNQKVDVAPVRRVAPRYRAEDRDSPTAVARHGGLDHFLMVLDENPQVVTHALRLRRRCVINSSTTRRRRHAQARYTEYSMNVLSPQSAIGEVLREARRRAGLSQAELAVLAGTSQASISDIERGRRQPTVELLGRLLRHCEQELTVIPRKPSRLDPEDVMLLRLNARLSPGQRLAHMSNLLRLRARARA